MALAAILGICLLLSIAPSVPAIAVWQSTQSQDSSPSNSSQQGSASQPPTDQPKAPEEPATPPQSPAATTQPCLENSQPGSMVKSDCKPAESTGAKTKKRHHKTVAPAATPTGSGPTKTVVRNGSTSETTVNLSPGVSSQQTSRQMESTNQLLATSDANLKKVSGRQLNPNQQDTVKQIKSYMEQAKTAAKGGDAQRAYNLAVKANLLSAELVGH
jgi:hypothetical protein